MGLCDRPCGTSDSRSWPNFCDQFGVSDKELITATKNRHRVSTIYASFEVPKAERSLFYQHTGHTIKEVNESTYQTPLAIHEVVKVGLRLPDIDEGKSF